MLADSSCPESDIDSFPDSRPDTKNIVPIKNGAIINAGSQVVIDNRVSDSAIGNRTGIPAMMTGYANVMTIAPYSGNLRLAANHANNSNPAEANTVTCK